MTKTPVLTFLSIFFLMSCSTDSKDSISNEDTLLKYDTSKTAVLSWDRKYTFPFDQADYDTAMLMQDDIHVIDSLLMSTVVNYNSSLTDRYHAVRIDLKRKNYRKQLIVAKNLKGEKIVWVNCFCRPKGKSWKTRTLMVEDGGPCYFNFKINLKTNTVYDFTVNGFG